MPRPLPALILALLAPCAASAAFEPWPPAGACPGAPLACFLSGGSSVAVAIGIPPRSLGILIAGPTAEVGPTFGSGRLCLTQPWIRLGSTQADAEGTAIVRWHGAPAVPGASHAQLLWREPLSWQLGASGVARLAR